MPFITLLIFGVLSACFALLFEVSIFSMGNLTNATFTTFQFSSILSLLIVAVVEESSKYLFLRQYAKRFLLYTPPTIQPSVILGMLFGLGFAVPEIALSFGFLALSLLPLLGVVLLHLVTSIVLTFVVLKKKESQFPDFLPLLAVVIVIHLVYNFVVSWVL